MKFRIKVYRNNKSVFLKGFGDKTPSFTPYEHEAHKFTDFSQCQRHRDNVLEFVDKADIEILHGEQSWHTM